MATNGNWPHSLFFLEFNWEAVPRYHLRPSIVNSFCVFAITSGFFGFSPLPFSGKWCPIQKTLFGQVLGIDFPALNSSFSNFFLLRFLFLKVVHFCSGRHYQKNMMSNGCPSILLLFSWKIVSIWPTPLKLFCIRWYPFHLPLISAKT